MQAAAAQEHVGVAVVLDVEPRDDRAACRRRQARGGGHVGEAEAAGDPGPIGAHPHRAAAARPAGHPCTPRPPARGLATHSPAPSHVSAASHSPAAAAHSVPARRGSAKHSPSMHTPRHAAAVEVAAVTPAHSGPPPVPASPPPSFLPPPPFPRPRPGALRRRTSSTSPSSHREQRRREGEERPFHVRPPIVAPAVAAGKAIRSRLQAAQDVVARHHGSGKPNIASQTATCARNCRRLRGRRP